MEAVERDHGPRDGEDPEKDQESEDHRSHHQHAIHHAIQLSQGSEGPTQNVLVAGEEVKLIQQPHRTTRNQRPAVVDEPLQEELLHREAENASTLGGRRNGRRRSLLGAVRAAAFAENATSQLIPGRRGEYSHTRFGLGASTGFYTNLDDAEQPMQRVLHGGKVVDSRVRNVPLVLEDQPRPDDELLRGQRVAIADVADQCCDQSGKDHYPDPELVARPCREQQEEQRNQEGAQRGGDGKQDGQRMKTPFRGHDPRLPP